MGQDFISCDRGQVLLPPSLTDWLPEDRLVWTVLGAVEQMDPDGFFDSALPRLPRRRVRLHAAPRNDASKPCDSADLNSR
jgi:hypothetical protein